MVNVYFSDITNSEINIKKLNSFPETRKDYINSISDPLKKKQSYFVFSLFCRIVNDKKVTDKIERLDSGKWVIKNNELFFSFSHSHNIVTVAISKDREVGIDVEKIDNKILKISDIKTLPVNISIKATDNKEQLTLNWTGYESTIKKGSKGIFTSEKIFDRLGNQYIITLCSDDNKNSFRYVDSVYL